MSDNLPMPGVVSPRGVPHGDPTPCFNPCDPYSRYDRTFGSESEEVLEVDHFPVA
jgi:hypothetical protein